MSFLAPSRLWLLLAVAALVVVYVVLQRRRRHYAVRFSTLELLRKVAPKRPGWRRHLAAGLVGMGLISMVVALARPVRNEKVAQEHATVMLVVDVSASMQAVDVTPNRLTAAVSAAESFVAQVPAGFEVGLVAYDRTPRVLATPTTDRGELLASLSSLTTGPGTATGDAIDVALATITSRDALLATSTPAASSTPTPDQAADPPTSTIVLLSDGTSTVGSSLDQAAQAAADQGVPVTTIAYGTPTGTVTVAGQTVAVPADDAAMAQLASATGGSSFTAASSAELTQVYETIQQRIGYTEQSREILRFFVAIAIVALLLGVLLSMVWGGRFL